jgi:hypothetical protein
VDSVANRNDPSTPARPTVRPLVVHASLAGVLGSVGDPDGTRAVTSIAALLVVLGIGLVMLAVWLFRVTRPDPEMLAPLEVMGERKWRRADPVWQRRRLDEVRPDGAEPLQPSAAPPDLDEAFDLGPAGTGFDDLQDAPDRDAPDRDGVSIPGDPLVAGITASLAEPAPVARRNGSLKIGPLAATSTPPIPAVTLIPAPTPVADEEPAGDPVQERPRSGHSSDGGTTPTGIRRPTPEDLPDHEIDPGLMAAAMAELDAELSRRHDPDR